MRKLRIAVIEDEPAIRRGVVDALRLTGYDVAEAADGPAGIAEANGGGVDLVLLDLMLPKCDGFRVLSEIRRVHPHRPVIVLTARGGEDDRVRGLKLGADDYVVKPFSARELLARIEAVLRRTTRVTKEPSTATFHEATVDLLRRELRGAAGCRSELSEMEAALLSCLLIHRDRAVTREELLGRVWGIGTAGLETRAVDMHVVRLRGKLKEAIADRTKEAILTVRSRGYMAAEGWIVATEERS